MDTEQFRRWSKLSSEAMLLVAPDGTVTAASAASERLGLRASEGSPLWAIAETPEAEVRDYLRRCARVTDPLIGTIRIRGEDGTRIDCACRGMRAPWSADHPPVILALSPKSDAVKQYTALLEKIEQLNREMSRRMDLEQALRERNEHLQVTLSSIGDGVIVADSECRVTLMNPVAEALTEWTLDDARGQPLEDVFAIVNEVSRERVDNPVSRAIQEGVIVGLANHTVLLGRNGAERPIDDCAAPIFDSRGKVLGGVLVFRDITHRREARRKLNEQSILFAQLADSMPQLVWMARPDGHIEWYNNRWYEYTGSTPDRMAGWGWAEVHDPEILPSVTERWKKALAAGEPFSMVFPLRGADGAFRPFLTRAVPFRDANGTIERWFGTNTDVSEQKRLEEDLRNLAARLSDSNRRKDEFLAMLGHELRNPLAPILTGLELLRSPALDSAQREDTRSMMERQTKQLVSLVDDLLDVSRITRGKLQLRKQPVDLSAVINAAVETARPFIEAAKLKLEIRSPSHPIALHADPNRLAQVISNLLHNAAKFTAAPGSITIESNLAGDDITLTVADTGCGIAEDKLESIFELFEQLNPTPGNPSGLGIGLTLVRKIVELHGGAITARSAGAGQGSAFAIVLPDAVATHGIKQFAIDADPTIAGKRVLVVDDNLDAAKTIGLLLRIDGHQIAIAHDGQRAVAEAERFRPEVILMDLGMPRLNGYEAAAQIRSRSWGKRIKIVALTGWGQREDRERTQKAGFDLHLVKPVDPAKLRELLNPPDHR